MKLTLKMMTLVLAFGSLASFAHASGGQNAAAIAAWADEKAVAIKELAVKDAAASTRQIESNFAKALLDMKLTCEAKQLSTMKITALKVAMYNYMNTLEWNSSTRLQLGEIYNYALLSTGSVGSAVFNDFEKICKVVL